MPDEQAKSIDVSASARRTDQDLWPRISGLEIIESIGTGGMSVVYKAKQVMLERLVAVKVLSKDAVSLDGGKRFERETKLTSELDHPNIVKVISSGISLDGQPYLMMEFLPGKSLAQELELRGRLNLQDFRDIFSQVLSALAYAHNLKLIHRDIKPENIMIERSDHAEARVKLLDFGIAKLFDTDTETKSPGLTRSHQLLGTPAYMSPEQCKREAVDGRSDLYSLACVMFESICGEPPFTSASQLELMHQHCHQAPLTVAELTRRVEICEELANTIISALAKDPSARPQSAEAFALKLASALQSVSLSHVPMLKGKSPKQIGSSKRISVPIIISLVLIVCCAIPPIKLFIDSQKQKKINPSSLVKDDRKGKDERFYLDSIAREEKRWGKDSPELVPGLYHFADWYARYNRHHEEEAVFRRVLAIRMKQSGDSKNATIADALRHVGMCLVVQGKHTDAIPFFERALYLEEHFQDKLSQKNAVTVARILSSLGDCYRIRENTAKAESYYLRFSKMVANGDVVFSELDTTEPLTIRYLGRCYLKDRNYPKARYWLNKSIAIAKEESASEFLFLQADALKDLGDCSKGEKKWSEAEELFKQSVQLRLTLSRDYLHTSELADTLNAEAECCIAQGRDDEAKKLRQQAKEAFH